MYRFILLLAALSGGAGCASQLQGPPVDLVSIVTPDPVPQAAVKPGTPLRSTPSTGQWEAWIPPVVQPNGDRVEGHWLSFDLTAPAEEVMAPAHPLPKVPRLRPSAKPTPEKEAGRTTGKTSPMALPEMPPAMTAPVSHDPQMAKWMEMLKQYQTPQPGIGLPLGGQ